MASNNVYSNAKVVSNENTTNEVQNYELGTFINNNVEPIQSNALLDDRPPSFS